jgi:fatty acid/phospholipid biosynthesis enzyme
VVSGEPAILPPPARAQLPESSVQERDTALETELQQVLTGFFKAYASGDTVALSRFTDKASITALGGAVTFGQLKEVKAPHGAADERTIAATVVWQIPSVHAKGTSAELEQTYELTVVKKDGTWYVRDIRGSTQPSGS